MKRTTYLLTSIMFAFLFIGGPDADSLRATKLIWDTGHLIFFGVLSIPIFKFLQRESRFSQTKLVILVGVVSLVFGLAIEIVQHFIGRSFSLKDLLYDVLGAYLGLTIYALLLAKKCTIQVKVALLSFAISISVYVLLPVTFAVVDQIEMKGDFPILADFESSFQLNRWEPNITVLKRERGIVRSGEASMGIEFFPAKYPGVTLIDFNSNWREYRQLKLSIFNPARAEDIVLKIYDRLHTHTLYRYQDRFNRKIRLEKGWNDIEIPLEQVESSPENRAMNMAEIVSLSLFIADLKKPVKLYIDDLYLVGGESLRLSNR